MTMSPILNGGFVNWDDPTVVLKNPSVSNLSISNIADIFKRHLTGRHHPITPLTIVSYALEYHYFGFDPFWYHLVSLALHLCNAVLVFLFIYFLREHLFIAFLAALLFGIHPIQVEAVAWVTAQKDLLCTFFYLIGLVLYVRQITTSAKYNFWIWVVFILALLSKSIAVTFPLTLLSIDYFLRGKITWASIKSKVPLLCLSFIFGVLTLIATKNALNYPDPFVANEFFSKIDRFFLSCYAFLFYGYKLLIPLSFSCIYPIENLSQKTYLLYGSPMILSLVFFLLSPAKEARFGLLFSLVTIFPMLHFFGIIDSLIFDRYFYLASIGFFFIIAFGMNQALAFSSKWVKKINVIIFTIIVCFLGFCALNSFRQTQIWRDSKQLWNNVIGQYPEMPVSYLNLAGYYYESGDYYSALALLEKTLELEPKFIKAYQNQGMIYFELGQLDKALDVYNTAVALDKNNLDAYLNRGNIYAVKGLYQKAIDNYNEALNINPSYQPALYNKQEAQEKLLNETNL